MLINRKQEILLHDLTDVSIGLWISSLDWIRWQAARLLIRWNALVIQGEDDCSPVALELKHRLDLYLQKNNPQSTNN